MPTSLPSPDAPIIAAFGMPAVHYVDGTGGGTPVSIVPDSTYRPRNQSQASFRVFFCQKAASGFAVMPKQSDHIVYGANRFRIFDTEQDDGGGSEDTYGCYLLCVRIASA